MTVTTIGVTGHNCRTKEVTGHMTVTDGWMAINTVKLARDRLQVPMAPDYINAHCITTDV